MPQCIRQVCLLIFLILSVISCSSTPTKSSSLYLPSDIQIESAICRDTTVKNGLIEPVKKTDHFGTRDTQAVIWVKLEDIKNEYIKDEHTLRWEWIGPGGKRYIEKEEDITHKGYKYKTVTSAHKIDIRDKKVANLIGKWQVKVYLDDSLKAQKSFTISESLCDIDSYIEESRGISTTPDEKKWGVIIGIENYQKTSTADYATKDAEIMKKYLTNFMSVPEGHTYMLLNEKATKHNIEELIEQGLPKKVKNGDIVYFYYSGHGVPDEDKMPYILPVDGDPYSPKTGAYLLEKVYANLGSLKAKNIYAFIDACFTGASSSPDNTKPIIGGKGVDVVLNPIIEAKKMLVISAAKKISNFYKEEEHGLFTYFLLKGLLGEADYDGNGRIHAEDELYRYVSTKVEQTSNALFGSHREQEPVLAPQPLKSEIDPWIVELKGRCSEISYLFQ